MGPDPAVADVRRAVRQAIGTTPHGSLVLAAVSGGADSLALLAALAWEAPRQRRRSGAVHVDHGLQPGSAEVAERVTAQAKDLEVDVVEVVHARPDTQAGGDGPEGTARRRRYAALDCVAERAGAAAVLLGHTRDDQAESVLLGLVRGSGGRSLAGIPPARGRYLRPLLGLSRATTTRACAVLGLEPWHDPTNADETLLRNRVRHTVLPMLERELGPGMAEALARSATLLRADTEFLDELVRGASTECALEPEGRERVALGVAPLRALPDALRTRVLHHAITSAGSPGGLLAAVHVWAVDELVTRWHGQGPVSLPGGLVAVRHRDRVAIQAGQT